MNSRSVVLSLRTRLRAGNELLKQRRDGSPYQLFLFAAIFAALGSTLLLVSHTYYSGYLTLHEASLQLAPASIWAWLTRFGDARILFVIAIVIAYRRPDIFWTLVIAAVVTSLATRGLKASIDIMRPAAVLPTEQLGPIGPFYKHHAFPSGHTASIFAFVGVIYAFSQHGYQRVWLLLFAILVAGSRVALGAHWPQDIIAGATVGLTCAGLSVWIASVWRVGLRLEVFTGLMVLPVLSVFLLFHSDMGNPATPDLILLVLMAVVLAFVRELRNGTIERAGSR